MYSNELSQKTHLNETLLWNLPENFVTENHKYLIISIYIYIYMYKKVVDWYGFFNDKYKPIQTT